MYKRIAVAVDGSKTSDEALAEAIKLARGMGSSILLIHVCEEMPVILEPDGMSVLVTQDLMQAIAKAGNALLQKGSASVIEAGVDAETKLIETIGGRMGGEISAAAHKWDADLLVVGTHGRRGIVHFLMGSVAEDIARTAAMPVLLVRGK